MSHIQVFLPFTRLDNGSPFQAYCNSVSYLRLNKENLHAGREIYLLGNNLTYEIQISVSMYSIYLYERENCLAKAMPSTNCLKASRTAP